MIKPGSSVKHWLNWLDSAWPWLCIFFIALGGMGLFYAGAIYSENAYKYEIQKITLRCACDLECKNTTNKNLCLGIDWDKEQFVSGIAFGDRYFCVWAKGLPITEVLNTCAHEWAHTHEGLIDNPADGG